MRRDRLIARSLPAIEIQPSGLPTRLRDQARFRFPHTPQFRHTRACLRACSHCAKCVGAVWRENFGGMERSSWRALRIVRSRVWICPGLSRSVRVRLDSSRFGRIFPGESGHVQRRPGLARVVHGTQRSPIGFVRVYVLSIPGLASLEAGGAGGAEAQPRDQRACGPTELVVVSTGPRTCLPRRRGSSPPPA